MSSDHLRLSGSFCNNTMSANVSLKFAKQINGRSRFEVHMLNTVLKLCRPEEASEMPAKACTKRIHRFGKVTKKIVTK